MARTKKPRLGRPPLGDLARSRAITVKLTTAEHVIWQAAADTDGKSLAEWLRAAAELAIARGSTR